MFHCHTGFVGQKDAKGHKCMFQTLKLIFTSFKLGTWDGERKLWGAKLGADHWQPCHQESAKRKEPSRWHDQVGTKKCRWKHQIWCKDLKTLLKSMRRRAVCSPRRTQSRSSGGQNSQNSARKLTMTKHEQKQRINMCRAKKQRRKTVAMVTFMIIMGWGLW